MHEKSRMQHEQCWTLCAWIQSNKVYCMCVLRIVSQVNWERLHCVLHLLTSSDALLKIGAFGRCINLLPDKSTTVKCKFCSKIRLSNDSRRLYVKLMVFNFVNDANASNSMKLMEFRLISNVCRCRRSWKCNDNNKNSNDDNNNDSMIVTTKATCAAQFNFVLFSNSMIL